MRVNEEFEFILPHSDDLEYLDVELLGASYTFYTQEVTYSRYDPIIEKLFSGKCLKYNIVVNTQEEIADLIAILRTYSEAVGQPSLYVKDPLGHVRFLNVGEDFKLPF